MGKTLWIVVACAAWSAPAYAGTTIGPLCFDGVRATPHPELKSTVDDGEWTPTDYRLDPAQARHARLIVFDKAIPRSDKFETCLEVSKRMNESGATLILSGRLVDLTLRALQFIGRTENRIQVNRGSFRATLGNVDSGTRPVAGGAIDFRGSQLWIRTSADVLSTPRGITGEFEIEAWNRPLTGVQLHVGDQLRLISNLQPKNGGNVTVRVDLHDGHAQLWSGNLVGQPQDVASGDLDLASLVVKSAALRVTRLDVGVASGVVDVTLSGLKGTGAEMRIPGPQLIWTTKSAAVAIDRAEGTADQESDGLTIAHAAVFGLNIREVETTIGSNTGATLFHGIADITFAALSESTRSGRSVWKTVKSTALDTFLPDGLVRLEWAENGATPSLSVSGRFTVDRMKLGGMDLGQSVDVVLAPAPLTRDLVIPFKVALPAASGTVSFLNGEQTVAVQGRLERLDLEGQLVIPLSDILESRLEIAPDKMHLGVGAAVSASPFIAGAKPNFVDTTLAVANDTGIRIARAGSTGTALLTATALVLAQPVVKIGDNGSRHPATFDLKADGTARLRYEFASGKASLVQAKLNAVDFEFSLVGPQPRILDLGGDEATDPRVVLKRLSVEIDQLSAIKLERAEFEHLNISASRLTKSVKPGTTSGISYSGTLSRPLTVAFARAARVSVGEAIVLGGFEISKLDLAISDASADFGGGIRLAHASFALAVDQLREISVLDRHVNHIQNARLSAEGKLAVQTADISVNDAIETRIALQLDGPEDALNGTGSLKFGTFTASARSMLVIKFDCRNTGQLDVPMETNFLVAGGDFQARMREGRLSADGATGPIAAVTHSLDPNTGCDSPVVKHIVQEKGKWWTDGICNRGWEIYSCRWESPEISYSYHIHLAVRSLSASVAMSNPHVYLSSDGQMSVCNVGALVIDHVAAVGGYSPGIDSNYPDLDNIVNGLIQLNLEPFQSTVLTGIGTGVGWFASSVATPAGNLLCVGKPL